MKGLPSILLLFAALVLFKGADAQIIKDPTKWAVTAKKVKGNEYQVNFHVTLEKGWHLWSLKPGGDGMQLPPEFVFENNPMVKQKGGVSEHGKKLSKSFDGVDGVVNYFEHAVDYTQLVTATGPAVLDGTYTYQVCDDHQCLRPKTVPFKVKLN